MRQSWITPDGHAIQVQSSDTGDSLTVKILNTGSEIPPESREKIFNKFYQADESHTTQGNGVGLAIVKKITQLHGGSVRVTSKDEGTACTATLPK